MADYGNGTQPKVLLAVAQMRNAGGAHLRSLHNLKLWAVGQDEFHVHQSGLNSND